MEKKQTTDEQKSKLRKLYGKVFLVSFFSGLKFAALVFFCEFLIVIINHFLVKNQGFVFCAVVFSTFLIFRSYRMSSSMQCDIFREEQKKILES